MPGHGETRIQPIQGFHVRSGQTHLVTSASSRRGVKVARHPGTDSGSRSRLLRFRIDANRRRGSATSATCFDGLLRDGVVKDYAELARLGQVSRARLTQIMSLLNLAPDIQEEILFLPPVPGEREAISERQVRRVAAIPDWREQSDAWQGPMHEESLVDSVFSVAPVVGQGQDRGQV